jgi:maltose O-acetyltransferase
MQRILRIFWLSLYYGFAKFLPVSFRFYPFGMISMRLRNVICKHIFKFTGKNVNIERGVIFGSGSEIEIGDNSGIGINCQMPSNVKIAQDVMMGPDVLILGQNHNYDSLEIPMRLQGADSREPVIIETDVWIGARVIILPGLRVGTGSIIGAGSVVTKDVPPFAICAGNPARVLKVRNGASQIENFEMSYR